MSADVHHNDTNCNTGKNRENFRQGTGEKQLCAECARLKIQGR